ncbi:hypothetical protein MBLNU457_4100t1 [Dothideomycetes sp. NU457]
MAQQTITSHLRDVHKHNLKTLRAQPLAELSGSLGDLGTLLPLMIALSRAGSIDISATLVFSGLANILTGVAFGITLPVQPMKAIAAVAITNSYSKAETASAGLFVGAVVAVLALTGLLRWATRVVPVAVVRGIQVGAGLSLVISAGSGMLVPLRWTGPSWADNRLWVIAAFVGLLLSGLSKRVPYALIVTFAGLVMAGILAAKAGAGGGVRHSFWTPSVLVPGTEEFRKGALEAGLPQLPLTTLNSVLAVASLVASLTPPFPSYPSTTSIGLSVGLINLVAIWFGAMPMCHGSGGLAAQYRFGARSGSSIIILGTIKLLLGLFAGERMVVLLYRFPKSLLGIMVIAAGIELAKVGRTLDDRTDLWNEAERESEDTEGRQKQRKVSDEESAERWAVMLVTVAGCLAFKNDAVGFIAGMIWHWGLKLSPLLEKLRTSRGHSTWRPSGRDAESESLLPRTSGGDGGRDD